MCMLASLSLLLLQLVLPLLSRVTAAAHAKKPSPMCVSLLCFSVLIVCSVCRLQLPQAQVGAVVTLYRTL
jgi:hypothetical protein